MIQNEFREHLTHKILPFWEKLKDDAFGGYYGFMDEELNLDPKADKGCILNSRILWTFATAARELKDDSLRPYADHAFEFLKRFVDPVYGGVYWSVTYDGQPKDTTKHTYCQAFAVYGLAAYYRMCGNAEALCLAMELFHLIESRCSDEGGYLEALKADFSPESNEKLSENGVMASRTMNTLLHVLESQAELYRAYADEEVRKAGETALERFLQVFYNPERRRQEVFCDNEYHSLLDMQSYGHDIEGSWLIWDAAETLLPENERAPWRDMCVDLLKSATERGFTDRGLRYEIVNGVNNEIRAWWPQAEALLGFEFGWRMTGDREWLKRIRDQWEYVRSTIVDSREGSEWFNELYVDGSSVHKAIVDEWKCPYPNGRMCMQMMNAALPEEV